MTHVISLHGRSLLWTCLLLTTMDAWAAPTPRVGCPNTPSGQYYVDVFTRAEYRMDRDFDPTRGTLSTTLRLHYRDGVSIDIDLYEITEDTVDTATFQTQIKQAIWGRGCRIFPAQLNRRTTPKLYQAKHTAIATMEKSNAEFTETALLGVWLNLPLPAGGLHPGPEFASSAARPRLEELPVRRGSSITAEPRPGASTDPVVPPGGPSQTSPLRPAESGFKHSQRAVLSREQKIIEYLETRGHKVNRNQQEGQLGAGRQGDIFLDGVKTELKSLAPGADDGTIRNVVNQSVGGQGQARSIIIDARGSGLTKDQAMIGIKRAMGISRNKLDRLRIIGDDFDISNL